jgi:hypothetical protein
MDYIYELINTFSNCQGQKKKYGSKNYKCSKNPENQLPLYMNPTITATIMLITESPSPTAANSKALNNRQNPTFSRDVLSLIFNNPDISYELLEKEFNYNFYWTHFCKCNSGGQALNQICAEKFLKKEIELFRPKLIITVGRYSAKYLFNIGRRKSMQPLVNKINKYMVNPATSIDTICITHFSGANCGNKEPLLFDNTAKLIRFKLKSLGIKYIFDEPNEN